MCPRQKAGHPVSRLGRAAFCGALLLAALGANCARAETGSDAWLRYAPLEKGAAQKYSALPASVVVVGDSPVLHSAKTELMRGVRAMLGRTLGEEKSFPHSSTIILGTIFALKTASPELLEHVRLQGDGFML